MCCRSVRSIWSGQWSILNLDLNCVETDGQWQQWQDGGRKTIQRKNLRNKHCGDKSISPVKFYTFSSFVSNLHENTKAGNERVLLTSVDSAAKVWSSLFLCGSVVHKLLKTHQWVTLLHRLPRHLVIMTVGDSLYWVNIINTPCMCRQGHQMWIN